MIEAGEEAGDFEDEEEALWEEEEGGKCEDQIMRETGKVDPKCNCPTKAPKFNKHSSSYWCNKQWTRKW